MKWILLYNKLWLNSTDTMAVAATHTTINHTMDHLFSLDLPHTIDHHTVRDHTTDHRTANHHTTNHHTINLQTALETSSVIYHSPKDSPLFQLLLYLGLLLIPVLRLLHQL
jgi:hypothetical protein